MDIKRGKRVLLIENFASDFYKARVPFCKFLIAKGWDVYALVPNDHYLELIQKEGIHVIGYDLNRKDKGLFQLIRLIKIYHQIIKQHNIDIIHSFRFQPNLLNVLANFFNKRKVILHITGLGIAFSNHTPYYLFLRIFSQVIFQIKFFRSDRVIVQNEDDAKDIWFAGSWKKKLHVIKGSGVNTAYFDADLFDKTALKKSYNIKDHSIVFILVTRLIWEKGIKELTDAFGLLQKKHKNIKLWIVGWTDKDNPRHVDEDFINSFENNDSIFFLGKKDNIRELLAVSDVFIYPSYYREGIPRSILEALSMGLPVITTDTPGCNLTVVPGENGYLIDPRSSEDIKDSVTRLIDHDDLKKMGIRSRELAENKFSNSIIFSQFEKLYA